MVVSYEQLHCPYCGRIQKNIPDVEGKYECYNCGADLNIRIEKINKYIINE